MAFTPIKPKKLSDLINPKKSVLSSPSSNSVLFPQTPNSDTPSRRSLRYGVENGGSTPVRKSSRRLYSEFTTTPEKPRKLVQVETLEKSPKTPKSAKRSNLGTAQVEKVEQFRPKSPELKESRKRKRGDEIENVPTTRSRANAKPKKVVGKRVYYKKVVYDGGEFAVGDDVHVKRREDASSDEEDPVVEECRVCFRVGKQVMIECDDCLGGFHLKCLKPPLKEVPDGDWVCVFCEAKKSGKVVEVPEPPMGKKRVRTLRAICGLRALREVDGTYWFRAHWYMIPEETASGRQPHNLKRELYRTNDFADVEMESVIRHCFVMTPKEFTKANNAGGDVFLCEYEYDNRWHSFKRLAEINDEEDDDNDDDNNDDAVSDEDFKVYKDADSDSEDEFKKGTVLGLQKIGTKKIPQHIRSHKQTELEKAKQTLLLATLPKSLPCRNEEMDEITACIKGAICEDQCLGRCLYIHGVPGTGKTMSVLAVMRNLKSELESGSIKPYCFIEINCLKLASAENIYRALSGHRVGWKKVLQLLNERFSEGKQRFSEGKQVGKGENKPCILLIDELDLLVTRNQSVLYNILDWPTRPNSKLIVIEIANTMDLPEKLLPRISSRMGIHRICFGPYTYQQLQEIIMSRLKGIDAFEKQAIEFASRKVAAISGDARRALEICRRAAEIADFWVKNQASLPDNPSAGKTTVVGMAEVEAAIQEMFQAPHIQVIRKASKLSKIVLAAMVHEVYKTGMGETSFDKVAATVGCFCASNGESLPGWETLLRVGLILCEPGAFYRSFTLIFQDTQQLPCLSKYL
ncbi:hypothetical protein RND81_04G242800 [Saponaria officinalis]|uniref:Origin recognition complex subunit 1 n=1 Tax=Saponaria officinalis TaxID=3572 RepID=A0AAW1LQD8_SAPOF